MEIKSMNEVAKPSAENCTFDPDRRIDITQKTDITKSVDFDPDRRLSYNIEKKGETCVPEKFYTSWEQREDLFPKNGEWSGKPGNSKFISNNVEVNTELIKFGLDGIEYKNGVPDFSKCSLKTCKIDSMTSDLITNFKSFTNKMVNEGEFSSKREVAEYKSNMNLAFHECSDMHTCQLVPLKIHQTFTHTGGRLECKERDSAKENGGYKFDE